MNKFIAEALAADFARRAQTHRVSNANKGNSRKSKG